MLKNKYTEKDLDVHTYGRGRDKKFIAYTDYSEKENRWRKTVYPDIEGNKAKVVAQVLRWLNSKSPLKYAVFNGETKIAIVYNEPPTYCETDGTGVPLFKRK